MRRTEQDRTEQEEEKRKKGKKEGRRGDRRGYDNDKLPWVLFRLEEDDVRNDRICANVIIGMNYMMIYVYKRILGVGR